MAQLDDAGFSVKLFFGCWFYFGVAFGVVDFTFQFTKKNEVTSYKSLLQFNRRFYAALLYGETGTWIFLIKRVYGGGITEYRGLYY